LIVEFIFQIDQYSFFIDQFYIFKIILEKAEKQVFMLFFGFSLMLLNLFIYK